MRREESFQREKPFVSLSVKSGFRSHYLHVKVNYINFTHLLGFLFTRFIVIIIIKRGWHCKAGRERLTPYQSEDPNPTTPTHRKKEEKGKTVGDK